MSTFITFAVILTFRVVIAFSFDTKIIAKTNKQKKKEHFIGPMFLPQFDIFNL